MDIKKYEQFKKQIKRKIQELKNLDFRELQFVKNEDTILYRIYFDHYYSFFDELEEFLQRHTAEEKEKLITETAKKIVAETVKYYRQGFSRGDKHPSVQDNFVLTDAVKFSINKNIASRIRTYREAVIWRSVATGIAEEHIGELEQRWRTLKKELKQEFQYDEYETGPFGNGRYAIVKEKMRKFLYLYEYISKGRGIARVWFFHNKAEMIEFKKAVGRGISDITRKINNEIIKKLEEVKE